MQISFVTCVNNFEIYNACVVSSLLHEQASKDIELIPIDNVRNLFSASSALNQGLRKAKGEIIVCCHQDVIFPCDWSKKLRSQIAVVESMDKNWGVLGTFGVSLNGKCVGHIVDPHGSGLRGKLPSRVQSIDEHCVIIRRASELEFDETLGGFHLYAADLCLQAASKGKSIFVIDACVHHLSPGTVNESFYEIAKRLFDKWKDTCPMLVIETTCGIFRVRRGTVARLSFILAKSRRLLRRYALRENKKFNEKPEQIKSCQYHNRSQKRP